MKSRLILCFAALLLLMAGCRSLGDKQADSITAQPSVSASALPTDTYAHAPEDVEASSEGETPQSGDIGQAEPSGITPQPDDTGPSSGQPESSDSPASGSSASSAAASDGMASVEHTTAALDDILQQLTDLDKLYSQLDDVQDSDLGD